MYSKGVHNMEDVKTAMSESQFIQQQIYCLKADLGATDYKLLKFIEGAITEDEYATVKAKREEMRNTINNLEEQLATLEERGNN